VLSCAPLLAPAGELLLCFPLSLVGTCTLPAKLISSISISFDCQVSMTLGTGQILLFAYVLQVSKMKQEFGE
jgi:hypothetical protein